MGQLTLSLLGGFEARTGPGSPVPVTTKKAQALLAYLALTPGQSHPRDKLAALLWADTAPGRLAMRFGKRSSPSEGSRRHRGRNPPGTADAITLVPGAVQSDTAAFERAVSEERPPASSRRSSSIAATCCRGSA